jgi:predicted 3-demethylubiquinone-9 3-methyltransferase (glyoxalase superfamily)
VQKVTPFLWFDQQAEEAARFYVSVFKDASVGKPMLGPDGKVLVMPFRIQGQEFSALSGGPQFKFNESVSFVVHCKDQKEVPEVLFEPMRGPESKKVMEAFMQMRKFDIAALERAAA